MDRGNLPDVLAEILRKQRQATTMRRRHVRAELELLDYLGADYDRAISDLEQLAGSARP